MQGPQIRVLYALPKGNLDHLLDLHTQLPYSIAADNRWLEGETGRKIMFDTYNGALDIVFVPLPLTEAEYLAPGDDPYYRILKDIQAAGVMKDRTSRYLLFFDGGHPYACGQSSMDARVAMVYYNGVDGRCAAMAMVTTPQDAPDYRDLVAFHELFHQFGAGHLATPPQGADAQDPALTCDLMNAPTCVGPRHYLDRYRRYYYSETGLPNPYAINTFNSEFLTAPVAGF